MSAVAAMRSVSAAPGHELLSAATLTIDVGAVVENWQRLRARAQAPCQCAAVVKADAYGLGAHEIAPALYRAGCRHFFVAIVEEGVRLRPILPEDAAIFVLHGLLPGTEHDCAEHDLVPVLNSLDQLNRWSDEASRRKRRMRAALQIDTGMARVGLTMAEADLVSRSHVAAIEPVLLMSHLVAAEERESPINALQLRRFAALRRLFPGIPGSLANSSGVFLGTPWHHDLLRPGAALYGVAPMSGEDNPMRCVVRLRAPLIQWRNVQRGDGVGYNHTWVAQSDTRVGTLSAGYADGLLRSLTNRAHLRFAGQTVPLIGRVSMDTITVDVSAIPVDALVPGAPFELIDEAHDVNALAVEASTNAYEILTSLGSRYRRNYLSA